MLGVKSRREELRPFRDLRPGSSLVQGCDSIFGTPCSSWHLQTSGCHHIPQCQPAKLLVVHLFQPQLHQEPVSMPAPGAAHPTASASMSDCNSQTTCCSHTPHCSVPDSPLTGMGSRPVAGAKSSLPGQVNGTSPESPSKPWANAPPATEISSQKSDTPKIP